MMVCSLLLNGWLLAALLGFQEPQVSPNEKALAQATPMTRATWRELCQASLGDARPVTAFRLDAQTKIREGSRRNEGRISYHYLAPDCLRFRFSKDRELGRFGLRSKEYWMRENDEVIWLKTRDYQSDRESIEEMAALAKNYLALSDPKHLRIDRIALLTEPPEEASPAIGRRYRKLTWLSVTSPDFALFGSNDAREPRTTYRVDLGLRPRDEEHAWAPEVAIIRTVSGGGRRSKQAILLRLYAYREQDGFHIPFELAVHSLDGTGTAFEQEPAQEVWITEADLRPDLKVEDFRPEG
ncbi:MAG: hypothetical protein CMJ89_06280 [Planctomycetes bacterium]|nr:hypothetical protein [Planctomycetota bacterium]